MAATKSVSVAGPSLLNQNPPDRLLESLNLIPGVKMEERSPGSYRLSVRGSSLRSPFGIRNIKIYLDDFIFTDASGNSYLNLLDPDLLQEIELYKGPESGDFGAVTGGTALLKTQKNEDISAKISGGSFQHFKGAVNIAQQSGKHFLQALSSYTTTDSYRDQAALERKFLFLKHQYAYAAGSELRSMVWLSDLHYETPGGLTLAQMKANPRQARPQTPTTPGSAEQKAGIYNKMIFAGLSNIYQLNSNISHFAAIQGSYNDFKNPFITNFEKRYEQHSAFRTHLNLEVKKPHALYETRIGFEGAAGKTIIKNYDNLKGIPGNVQNFDNLTTHSGFLFLSQKATFANKLFVDLSGSLNLMQYRWHSTFPETETGRKRFNDEILPNLGVTYRFDERFSVRGKIGKGNSAPTTEEIRSSAQEINSALEAEYGWNKEIGLRKQWGNILFTELSLFDFRLKNAIVRRENEQGQEYFVNAGETVQRGIEFIAETKRFTVTNAFLKGIKFYFSGNFYDFTFKDYRKNGTDLSGNKLTGVPTSSLQSLVHLQLLEGIQIDISHFYTSSIPLNDANTVKAEPSMVGNISASYPFTVLGSDAVMKLGIQNLYNTKYSLGYDINAFGGRFYNPAASRSYVLSFQFML